MLEIKMHQQQSRKIHGHVYGSQRSRERILRILVRDRLVRDGIESSLLELALLASILKIGRCSIYLDVTLYEKNYKILKIFSCNLINLFHIHNSDIFNSISKTISNLYKSPF